MRTIFKGRVTKLEKARGMDSVAFRLKDGSIDYIPRRQLMNAMSEAFLEEPTHRARVLLNATEANDKSELHSMIQALYSGPAEASEDAMERVLKLLPDEHLEQMQDKLGGAMRIELKRRIEKLEQNRKPEGIWVSAAESQAIFEKFCSKLYIKPPHRVYRGYWLRRESPAEAQISQDAFRKKIWDYLQKQTGHSFHHLPLSAWIDAMREVGQRSRSQPNISAKEMTNE